MLTLMMLIRVLPLLRLLAKVVEEIDETQFWLDYLVRIHLLDRGKSAGIFTEVDELVKLFTAIKSRMKEKPKL